jgi:hypothetical protein
MPNPWAQDRFAILPPIDRANECLLSALRISWTLAATGVADFRHATLLVNIDNLSESQQNRLDDRCSGHLDFTLTPRQLRLTNISTVTSSVENAEVCNNPCSGSRQLGVRVELAKSESGWDLDVESG